MSEENKSFNIGGDLIRAQSGDYNVDVRRILAEAWSHTLNNRFSIVLGMVFVFFISMICVTVAASFMGDIETLMQDPQSMMIINLVVTVVTAPFLIGVEMMGVYHAAGRKTKPNMVFSFLGRSAWVVIASLLTMTLTNIGFQLLIIPGIFLLVAFLPVNQLVVEKNMTAMQAIVTCAKTFFRKQWLQVFALFAIVFGCAVACMLPMVLLQSVPAVGFAIFLVLLTFLIPFYYNVKGVLYRDVFGVISDKETLSDTVVSQDNTFDA